MSSTALLIASLITFLIGASHCFYFDNVPWTPITLTTKCQDVECKSLVLKIYAPDELFTYSLILNGELFEGNSKKSQANCYYRSSGDNEFAALGICDGQVDGVVSWKGVEYEVHYDSNSQGHRLYKDTDFPKVANGMCGMYRDANNSRSSNDLKSDVEQFTQSRGKPTLELLFVNDKTLLTRHFNRDAEKLTQFNAQIVNIINNFYQPTGIRIVLKDIIIWKDIDILPPVQQVDGILVHARQFGGLAAEQFYKEGKGFDVAMLLTGAVLEPSGGTFTLGIARARSICSERAHGVVHTTDAGGRFRSLKDIALTIAHETGHNIGQRHVEPDDVECKCSRRSGRQCIMYPFFSPTEEWSPCTIGVFNGVLANPNISCLGAPAKEAPELVGSNNRTSLYIALGVAVAVVLLVVAVVWTLLMVKKKKTVRQINESNSKSKSGR